MDTDNKDDAVEFEEVEVTDGVDRDWILQLLVTSVNYGGGHRPITLWTSTGLISGLLISGQEYIELFIDQFSVGLDAKGAEESAKMFREVGRGYYSGSETVPDANNTIFIHLKDAQLVSMNGFIPTEQGVLWRGRISQVTGFSLGLLSEQPRAD